MVLSMHLTPTHAYDATIVTTSTKLANDKEHFGKYTAVITHIHTRKYIYMRTTLQERAHQILYPTAFHECIYIT